MAKHAVSEEDKLGANGARMGENPDADSKTEDPMQGLEGLDVAGPRPASNEIAS